MRWLPSIRRHDDLEPRGDDSPPFHYTPEDMIVEGDYREISVEVTTPTEGMASCPHCSARLPIGAHCCFTCGHGTWGGWHGTPLNGILYDVRGLKVEGFDLKKYLKEIRDYGIPGTMKGAGVLVFGNEQLHGESVMRYLVSPSGWHAVRASSHSPSEGKFLRRVINGRTMIAAPFWISASKDFEERRFYWLAGSDHYISFNPYPGQWHVLEWQPGIPQWKSYKRLRGGAPWEMFGMKDPLDEIFGQ